MRVFWIILFGLLSFSMVFGEDFVTPSPKYGKNQRILIFPRHCPSGTVPTEHGCREILGGNEDEPNQLDLDDVPDEYDPFDDREDRKYREPYSIF